MKGGLEKQKRRLPRGYSLVEIMAAAGVGLVVILTMLSTLLSGTDGFDSATRRIDALVEARAAMRVMADDVSTVISIGNEEFGWKAEDENFHEVWFLTLKPEGAQDVEKTQGDVCFVHYFTAVTQEVPIEGAAFSRKLYRRFLSSEDVLGSLRQESLPAADANPEEAEAIAFNVTRFIARPLVVAEGGGALVEWMRGAGSPESLAIEFQVVDGDTAEMLQTVEDWNLSSALSRNVIAADNEGASRRGRDFEMNLKIGQAN